MSAGMVLKPLISIGSMFLVTAASAEVMRLSGDTIKSTMTGATLELDTPLGTTIPMRFTSDGLVSGEATGTVATFLGGERDRGRWWVDNHQLCVKWFKWFDAQPQCLVLRQQGSRIFWQAQDGKNGSATIAEQKPAEQPVQQVAARDVAPEPKPVVIAPKKPPVVAAAAALPAAPVPAAKPVSVERPAPVERKRVFELAALPAVPPPRSEVENVESDAAAAPVVPVVPEPVASAPPEVEAPAAVPRSEPPQVVKADVALPKRPVQRTLTSSFSSAGRTETPAATPSRSASPYAAERRTFRVARVDPDDVLNIRNGPSEYSVPVGSIVPRGRGIKIVGRCRGSWCPIQHGRVNGWVNAYYLAPEFPEAAELSD